MRNKILKDYLDDIAKYADISQRSKTRNCFLSIPRQLAKENKKFQFSVVEQRGRARKYVNSLEWLKDANLIRYCNNVSVPAFPLNAYVVRESFKIYLNDIWLCIFNFMYKINS